MKIKHIKIGAFYWVDLVQGQLPRALKCSGIFGVWIEFEIDQHRRVTSRPQWVVREVTKKELSAMRRMLPGNVYRHNPIR